MQRLQKLHCVPRIMDSFQEVPHYPGELYFFSHSDPLAPRLEERLADLDWKPEARLQFALEAIRSLREMHAVDGFDVPFVHRNISPSTVRVVAENSVMYTNFELSRTSTSVTVCRPHLSGDTPPWIAPEILQYGRSASDQRTDVYALTVTLSQLFQKSDSDLAILANEALMNGRKPDPRNRLSLSHVLEQLEALGGSNTSIEQYIPSWHYWSEGLVVPFRGNQYEITSRIGDGGLGVIFAVQELESGSLRPIGEFAAKVLKADLHSEQILGGYRRIRAISCDASFATVFEVAEEYKQDRVALLVEKVSGRPLTDWISVFELCEEEIGKSPCDVAISWATSLCDALCKIHRHALVHGDISPDNIIELEGHLTVIDFDLVQNEGEVIWAAGKITYCPTDRRIGGVADRSHDVYSLAATLFHVVFGQEPFLHEQGRDRGLGPNWNEIETSGWSWLPDFINKATSSQLDERFADAMDAAAWIAVKETAAAPLPLPEFETNYSETATENIGNEFNANEQLLSPELVDLARLIAEIDELRTKTELTDLSVSTQSSQEQIINSPRSQESTQRIVRVGERLIFNGHQQDPEFQKAPDIAKRLDDHANHKVSSPEMDSYIPGEQLQTVADTPAPEGTYDWIAQSDASVMVHGNASNSTNHSDSEPHKESVVTAAEYLPRKAWLALASWAKDKGYLNSWERKFLYSLGLQRSRLTERQRNIAEPLLDFARRNGFRN